MLDDASPGSSQGLFCLRAGPGKILTFSVDNGSSGASNFSTPTWWIRGYRCL